MLKMVHVKRGSDFELRKYAYYLTFTGVLWVCISSEKILENIDC